MKISIKSVYSKKMRVLSAFLAFLIFTLVLTQGFVRIGKTVVRAADGDDLFVTKYTKESKIVSKGDSAGDGFTYTKNIKPTKVMMYDFLTDGEITGGDPVSTYNGDGFADPFTTFNNAISNQTFSSVTESASNKNVTIRLELDDDDQYGDAIYVHMGINDDFKTQWPGLLMTFTQIGSNGRRNYSCTFNLSEIGFTPNKYIFSCWSGGTKKWETSAATCSVSAGNLYYFNKSGSTGYYSGSMETGGAEAITTTHYTKPLYVGSFIYSPDTAQNYLLYPLGYSNFYWQANMALRGNGNYDASVQGLVDSSLGSSGQLTQNGRELPYFSSSWAGSHNSMNAYENGGEGYYFPFYEVTKNATSITDYVSGGASDYATEKAKYYQFDSTQANVFFDSSKGFKESTDVVTSGAGAGFFPFNEKDTGAANNNCGFGAKFEMTFKLSKDGTVNTVDANGNAKKKAGRVPTVFEFTGDDDLWVFIDGNLVLDMGGDHSQSSGSINFYTQTVTVDDAFTFGKYGRQNLAVSHSAATVSGNSFVNLLSGDNPKDYTVGSDGRKNVYDEGVTHTMTVFYMERGMLDSNLKIRYNFPVEANFSKMKIQEVTDFSDINTGLLDQTKKAAEDDVFQYTVYNTPNAMAPGNEPEDMTGVGILYPTYDEYIRTNEVDPTLTTTLTKSNPVADTAHVYLNTAINSSDFWDKDNAKIAAYVYNSGQTGQTVWGEYVSSHLYRFDITYNNGANAYTRILFIRFSNNSSPNLPQPGNTSENTAYTTWNTAGRYDCSGGQTFKMSGWNSASVDSSAGTNYYYGNQKYNFNAQTQGGPPYYDNIINTKTAVSGTSYLWVDGFSVMTNDYNDNLVKMTEKTDSSGRLYLMYGLDDVESSAEFESQFRKNSTMTVAQSTSLYTPNRVSPHATLNNSTTRSFNTYYTLTDVSTFTRFTGNEVSGLTVTDGTDGKETSFTFTNGSLIPAGRSANDAVMMTETFTNAVKVGTITVTKTLDPAEIGTSPDYSFKIELKDLFGTSQPIEAAVLPAKKYDLSTGNHSDISLSITAASGSTPAYGTFTLKADERLVIEGIPVETKYKVTETSRPVDFEQKSNSMSDFEAARESTLVTDAAANDDNYLSTDPDNNESVVNSRKVGSITLSKSLSTKKSSGTNGGENQNFTFTVQLTKPSGVNWSDYTLSVKDQTDTDYTHTVSDSGNVRTVTLSIPATGSTEVTIGNIPYQTGYSISETSVSDYVNVSNGTISGSGCVITNSNSDPDYDVVNRREVGTLNLTKTLAGDSAALTAAGVSSGDPFTFEVTLVSPEHVDLDDYLTSAYLTGLASGTTAVYTARDESASPAVTRSRYVIRIPVPAGGSVRIGNISDHLTGIPYGTTCTVTEDYTYSGSPAVTHSKSGEQSDIAIDSTHVDRSVNIINSYSVAQTGTLTLDKERSATAGSSLPSGAGSDEYIFSVTLNAPTGTDWSDPAYDVTGLPSGVTLSAASETFDVPITAGTPVTISDLPYGTTYSVSEPLALNPTPAGYMCVTDIEDDDPSGISDTHAAAEVTVYNTYTQLGSLVMSKELEASAGSSLPSGVDDSTGFDFDVILTAPEGHTWSEYISGMTGLPAPADYTVSADGTTLSFTQTVASEDTLSANTIVNVPYGAEYSVVEDYSYTTSPYVHKKTGDVPTTDPGTIGVGTNASGQNAVNIKNTYTQEGTLYLNKTLTGDDVVDSVGDSTPFDFKVTLTVPAGTTWTELTEAGNFVIPSGVTSTDGDTVIVIHKNVTESGGAESITNIPYGTEYDVEEDYTYTPGTGETNITHHSSGEVTGQTIGSSNSVTIENTYTQLGSIVLNKDVVTTPGSNVSSTVDGDTDFEYNVELIFPASVDNTVYESGITRSDNGSIGSFVTSGRKYSFTVDVSENDPVTISGIPYNVQYTVTETRPTYASNPNIVHKVTGGEVTSTSPGTVGINTNESGENTVTIVNTYTQTGSLTLKKDLSGAYADVGVAVSTPFTFHVKLYAPAGSTWSDLISSGDFSVPSGAQNVSYTTSDTVCEFDIAVRKNDSPDKTITNIPFGTKYSVTEDYTFDNSVSYQDYVHFKDGEIADDNSKPSVSSTNPDPEVTITNTYTQVGRLELTKTLDVSDGSTLPSGVTSSTPFIYDVILTAPSGIDLRDYIDSSSLGALSGGTYGADTYSFSVEVSEDDPKSIENIPIGTRYTVSEETPSAIAGYDCNSSGGASNLQLSSSSGVEVPVTNTYTQTGSLELQKTAEATSGSTLPASVSDPDKEFTFNVTLVAPSGVNLTDFVDVTSIAETGGTYNSGSYTFNVKVKSGASNKKTITNIPYGTQYIVEEEAEASISGYRHVVTGEVHDEDDSSVSAATQNATVVNTYTQLGDLTVNKDLAGSYSQFVDGNSDTIDQDTEFDITLTLNAPSGHTWSEYSSEMTGITGTGVSLSADGRTYTIVKSISDNDDGTFKIENIPFGSTYTIEEDRSGLIYSNGTCIVSGEVTDKSFAGTITETVTNTYSETGFLRLKKQVIHTSGSTIPSGASLSSYDFSVTLYAPTGHTWSEYTVSGLPSGVTLSGLSTTFTVSVPSDDDDGVLLNYLPFGTKYAVSESYTFAPATYPNIYFAKSGEVPDDNSKPEITSADAQHEVTVTNTYTQYSSLVLRKALDGEYTGAGITAGTGFTYHVTLTAPNDETWADNPDCGFNPPAGYTTSQDGKTYEFDVTGISVNGPAAINYIPYGTTYSVTEDYTYTGSSSYTHTRSGEVDAEVGETAEQLAARTVGASNEVEITNSYSSIPTNSLRLEKLLDGDYDSSAETQPFTFLITLSVAPGVDKQYYIDNIAGATSESYYENEGYGYFDIQRTVTQSAPVTITDLPVGTGYIVVEQNPGASWQVSPLIQNGLIGIVQSTAQITNTYVPPRTITLYKQDAETEESLSGAQFVLLRLADDLDITDSTVRNAFSSSADANTLVTAGYATVVGTVQSTDLTGHIYITEGGTISFDDGGKYFFYETAAPTSGDDTYVRDNTLSDDRIITVSTEQSEYSVTHKNYRNPHEVELEKVDADDPDIKLSGAVFDLFFKESIVPPTYSTNEPEPVPVPTRTSLMNGSAEVPDPEQPQSITTYSYRYTYSDESVPSASDEDWILPRTDNDYIYFRDYNTGTTGLADKCSFNDGSGGASQNGNRSWLWTGYETNKFGQSKEIRYTHNYWYAAQFSASGKQTVEYAVWERFVDRYSNQDTVIWKIQPPDGYNYVRFLLYDGNQCVRTTVKFFFTLGAVYNKTSWGGIWKMENGKECYFEVPVQQEKIWTTYSDAANISSTLRPDKRTTSSAIEQADRYTPTEQKIVFHCNSKIVWHNIHIEFFEDAAGLIPVGQRFPGYMMEPYAYAGSDYRINGYLTYELTIPAEARYFRVNNGIRTGNYDFQSLVTALKTTEGRKNYGNYFQIRSDYTNVISGIPVVLTSWDSYTSTGDKWNETYSSFDMDSDYDYVYFEAPSNWGSHIYAYFYGGGDLRKDNWQRACYSVWPGVAPVGSEYRQGLTRYHSDVYNYTYTGNLYTGTTNSLSNPESSFTKGSSTIYKFRIPKGDSKNYSKVIFNNGLQTQLTYNGGDGRTHETGVISYKPGYIYNSSGSSTKHYDIQGTYSYTKRGSANSDDYIYIKTSDTSWDDMHIVFYDASGNQILQGGKGYVMEYSGTQGGNRYFRAPIPVNASKFSLNNGMNKSGSYSKQTEKTDILRLDTSLTNTASADYTRNRLVYSLSSTTLTRTSPSFNLTTTQNISVGTPQDSHVDYDIRQSDGTNDDMLYIRDTAGWNIQAGAGKVKFYDADGDLISSSHIPMDGRGTYTLVRTVADSGSPAAVWYTVPIPEDAATFTVIYNSGNSTTQPYAIYPYGDGSSEGSYTTSGNMYYETNSGGALSTLEGAVTELNPPVTYDYVTRDGTTDGGDNLYLVCTDKNRWKEMTVTFYADTTVLKVVPAEYLNEVRLVSSDPEDGESTTDPSAAGYWFRAAIPMNATSFTVTGKDGADSDAEHTTSDAEIYELSQKLSRYKKDYTLGDMQYRLPIQGTSKPTLLYPVFTEDDSYTLDVGDQTISSQPGVPLIDESQVTDYAGASNGLLPSASASEPTNPYPVLYESTTNNYSVSWTQEVAGDGMLRFDNSVLKWSTVKAYFYSDAGTTIVGNTSGYNMTTDTGYIVKTSVPDGAVYVKFTKNGSTSSGEYTAPINMSSQNYGRNRLYTPATTTTTTQNSTVYAYWSAKGVDSNTDNNQKVIFYGSNGSTVVQEREASTDGKIYDSTYSVNVWKFTVPSNAYYVAFGCQQNNTGSYIMTPKLKFRKTNPNSTTETIDFDYLTQYVRGTGRSGNTAYYSITALPSGDVQAQTINIINASGTGSWTTTTNGQSSSTYTATYQPEDRYSLITASDVNGANGTAGTADTNNFIYISGISTPYVMFYTGTNGSGTAIGAVMSASNGTPTGSTTVVSGVKANASGGVRVPRGAKSFRVSSSAGGTLGNYQNLYENITVYSSNGQITGGTGEQIAITGYHHAGTTFTVNSSGNVTSKTLRTGYTINRTTTMTDPLYPRDDSDFVFFTDTSGSFASGGTVYAYFYGDTDGEYTSWPGIAASQSSTEPTTYTDNNGKTVYMFRVPDEMGSEGKYKYVIFNNGSETGRKITRAQTLTAGKNYVLDTSSSARRQYGTDGTNAINAYSVTVIDKASPAPGTPVPYSTSGTNNYIYIINNGTQNLSGETVESGRYVLDEIHVVFYDNDKNVIGTDAAGYIPDKLYTVPGGVWTPIERDGGVVYRIQVPNGAKFFQINNGQNKVYNDSTVSRYNIRQSEIKELTVNGLYKFVSGESEAASYIQQGDALPSGNTAAEIAENRQNPRYLLTLVNQREMEDEEIPESDTYDVHLATVVTGGNGKPAYIQWLKLNTEETEVDREYLDHTTADIGPGAGVTTVKVVKTGTYYWKEVSPPSGYEPNYEEYSLKVEGSSVLPVSVTVPDEKSETAATSVHLTKIAKDRTTAFDLGEKLGAGYGFMLYDADGSLISRIVKKSGKSEYYYIPAGDNISSAKYQAMLRATDSQNRHVWEVNAGATDFVYYNTTHYNSSNQIVQMHTGANGGRTDVHEMRYAKALMTDDDSGILIENLPIGSYYLEEVGTPSDSLYSKNMTDGWVTGSDNRYCPDTEGEYLYKDRIPNEFYYDQVQNRVEFVVAVNNNTSESPLEIVSEEEMTPGYIRLYEHINEWRHNEWGDPTFVFRIKQTHAYNYDYDGTALTTDRISYTPVDNGREYIIALTVDDEGCMTMDMYKSGEYNNWYLETTVKGYNGLFSGEAVSGNDDSIYADQRLFGLDSSGWLRVEPGKYTISRVGNSRYEYVDSYSTYSTSADAPWLEMAYNSSTGEFERDNSYYRAWYRDDDNNNPKADRAIIPYTEETITDLEVLPYRVVDVHYYDRVAYYDKHSQVDTDINKFFTTDENGVSAIKGIRIDNYTQTGITGDDTADTVSVTVTNDTVDPPESVTTTTMTVPINKLRIYQISADGSERLMTDAEKLALFTFGYTPAEGDEAAFAEAETGFSYDAVNKQIVINNASDYASGVYTLNAEYNGFTAEFDLIFKPAEEPSP